MSSAELEGLEEELPSSRQRTVNESMVRFGELLVRELEEAENEGDAGRCASKPANGGSEDGLERGTRSS